MDLSKITAPNPNRKPLFIPSLSAGGTAASLKKNREVEPGLTTRFYAEDFPEEFRHPYFLITAGHFYKKMDARITFGLENVFTFGDSGGFQIASGAIKWDVGIRDQILAFLEENSDVAANLDIPPRMSYEGKFQESLDFSYDNFKYFANKQQGKTKFLNVLQGNNPSQFNLWYDTVKHFDFKGWCVGGSRRLVDFIYTIALFLENREFENPRNEFIHMLGISKVSDFFVLGTYQALLNKHYGGKIQLMTDSSSPGQFPVYGDIILAPNFGTLNWTQMHVSRDIKYTETKPIPVLYHTPVSKNFTMGVVNDYKQEYYDRATIQNLLVFNKGMYDIADFCSGDVELLQGVVPSDMYIILKSIHEMFDQPDNAYKIYEKYRHYYVNYGGDWVPSQNREILSSFFEN
jgi:hypothetical protein